MPALEDAPSSLPADAPYDDPLRAILEWHAAARAAGAPQPDAMTLATATPDGRPSARIVLFKGIVRGGIFFVTNYRSRKARELDQNPQAALVFHFADAERQIRIEGRVERATAAESDDYYRTRPHGSQLGAWASPQSQPIPDRASLEARVAEIETRFPDTAPPRPDFWGGYLVIPHTIELWLGRPDRLHDRFLYTRTPSTPWTATRLAP